MVIYCLSVANYRVSVLKRKSKNKNKKAEILLTETGEQTGIKQSDKKQKRERKENNEIIKENNFHFTDSYDDPRSGGCADRVRRRRHNR